MLIRIFKANNPVAGFSLLIIAALLWLPFLLSKTEVTFSGTAMPFYSLMLSLLPANKILTTIFSILLIVSEAILLNYIIQQFHLLKNQTYLPALVYVVLMSSLPAAMFFHPVLFASLFLILALKRCLDLSGNTPTTPSAAFDSAFFVSVGSLFYFPAILFLVFVWISLVSFRPFSFRAWIIAFIGICIPYSFITVYFYWFGRASQFWQETIIAPLFNKVYGEVIFLKSFYAFIIFLFLVILYSIPSFLSEIRRNKASIRTGLRLFIWFGLISLLAYFLASPDSLYHFSLAAIPLSIIFSNMFLNIKPVISEIIFTLFFFFIVIYQVNYF